MSTITIKNVTKAFGDVVVLKEFDQVFRTRNSSHCWDLPAAERPPCCG